MRGRNGLATLAAAWLALVTLFEAAAADELDDVLARWERQTAGVRTVEAWFTLVRRSPGWDDDLRLEGRARLAPHDKACVQVELTGQARADAEAAGKPALAHRTVCDGARVYEFDPATRHLYVFPQETPGGQSSWEEASLFLYHVRAEEVRKKYRLVLLKATPRLYLLQAFPRDGAGGSSFSRADLALDRETFLPTFLRTFALNGKDSETYRFTRVRRDVAIDPAVFRAGVPRGWTVVRFAPETPPPADPAQPPPPPIVSRPRSPDGGR